jgi:hypothetical protein
MRQQPSEVPSDIMLIEQQPEPKGLLKRLKPWTRALLNSNWAVLLLTGVEGLALGISVNGLYGLLSGNQDSFAVA